MCDTAKEETCKPLFFPHNIGKEKSAIQPCHWQRDGDCFTNSKTDAGVAICCRVKEELRHFDLMNKGESFYSLK